MSWTTIKLGDACDVIAGGTPKRAVPTYWGGGVPWVKISDMLQRRITRTDETISEEGLNSSAAKLLPRGTLLISIFATIGRTAVLECDAATNQAIVGVIPKDPETFDSRFLEYSLQQKTIELQRQSRGVAQANINGSMLKATIIPLPPLAEQKQIAGILDAADALRARRRKALAQLDTLLQSTFLDMFGDPVTNPMGWKRKKLGDFINFVGGSQPPKHTFIYEPRKGYVRLVQIRDFKTDRYCTYIPEPLAKRPFAADDVMIARYGPPVFQILTGLSGSYNVALMKAEPIGNVERRFIFFLLSLPAVNAAIVAQSERTAGQSGVNLKFLNNYLAYLPPLELQRRFAAIVESVEQQKARMRAHLTELNALFASLQSRAFNGEL